MTHLFMISMSTSEFAIEEQSARGRLLTILLIGCRFLVELGFSIVD